MSQKTQKTRVVDELNRTGRVNNFWAIDNYILRLGAIIYGLTKEGYEFNGSFGEGRERKNWTYKVTKKPELKLF